MVKINLKTYLAKEPICASCIMIWSTNIIAIIASAIGTALIPTQGSCLPFVTIFVFLFSTSTEFFSINIELVGFTAKLATIGWPVEIPPIIPP